MKIHRLKKLTRVPKKLPTKGKVGLRPVSFHGDKRIDKWVVTGGGYSPVVTQNKAYAMRVAKARIRVMKKHAKRKKRRRKK